MSPSKRAKVVLNGENSEIGLSKIRAQKGAKIMKSFHAKNRYRDKVKKEKPATAKSGGKVHYGPNPCRKNLKITTDTLAAVTCANCKKKND